MLRRIFFFTLLIFCLQIGFSQVNFQPGYIVEEAGDTVRGYIDYRGWIINPKQIYFKSSIEEEPVLLKPGDIDKFLVNKDLYVSAFVKFETSPVMTSELEIDSELSFETDNVFLLTLVSGEKSLYHLKSKDGRDNYYIGQKPDFDLLIYKRYIGRGRGDIIATEYGNSVIKENNKYLGQLMYYLQDCPGLRDEVEDLHYTQRSLMNLFNYYYKCTNSEMDYRSESNNLLFDFGMIAGVNYSIIDLSSQHFIIPTSISYSNSVDFAAGFYVDLFAPRNLKKWALHNELMLRHYKFTGRYEDIRNQDNFRIYTASIGSIGLKMNTLIRFHYPLSKFKFFLNGGISNSLSLKEVNSIKTEVKFFSTEKTEEGKLLSSFRKHEQGFIFGTGIKYNSFLLEARYEIGNGMSAFSNLKSRIGRYTVLLGVSF